MMVIVDSTSLVSLLTKFMLHVTYAYIKQGVTKNSIEVILVVAIKSTW